MILAGALAAAGLAQPSLAGIITACASVLSALALVLGSVALLLPILRRTNENHALNEQNKVAIGEIHTIVNQQRTDLMRYQGALVKALEAAGIPVPEDQSSYDAPQPS